MEEEKLDLSVHFLDEKLLFGWTGLDLYRQSEAQKNYILWDILSSKKLHNIYFLYGKSLATQTFKAQFQKSWKSSLIAKNQSLID